MPTYTQKEVDEMMRNRSVEEAKRAVASGRVVLMPPITDKPHTTKHSERDVTVHDAPPDKQRRKFTGQKRRHCSRCPFPEGCVVCTLP